MNNKRLYRSRDQLIGGVAAGIAEYIGVDPTLVRLVWVLLAFLLSDGGVVVFIYFLCWIIVPEAPDDPVAVESNRAEGESQN